MRNVVLLQILLLNSVVLTSEIKDDDEDVVNSVSANTLKKTFVGICCPLDKARKVDVDGCHDYLRHNFTVNITRNGTEDQLVLNNNKLYGFVFEEPCEKLVLLEHDFYDDEKWIFLQNGSIKVSHPKLGVKNFNEYCLANVIDDDANFMGTYAYHCFHPPPSDNNVRLTIYSIGMITSLPFLLVTFLIYLLIPELRNLPGKILLCYLASLISSFISLSISQLQIISNLTQECKILGYWSYFSLITSFFWLNVMGIDLWAHILRIFRNSKNKKVSYRFLKYCCYGYGVPIVLLIIAVTVDHISNISSEWKPNVAVEGCFLANQWKSMLLYYHGPAIILITLNIYFCIHTGIFIFKSKRDFDNNLSPDCNVYNSTQTDKERLFLYLRLIILMGISWIMESISWIFGDESYLFYATDFFNGLQGVVIFFLFICRPKIGKLIKRRWSAMIS